jgi:uncharacterized membrane protein YfcA
MDMIFAILPLHLFLIALAIAFVAGVIKGIVGFAMPMIFLSGLSSFTAPDVALAALIVPTLVTNGMQAFRFGLHEVGATIVRFRYFLIVGGITILGAAQLVPVMPTQILLLAIGLAVTGFALWQISGVAPPPGSVIQSRKLDVLFGAFSGFFGGISGIWGPPTVAYLTVIGTEKRQQMLAQGLIYGLGAVLLLVGHLKSGVLNTTTAPLSFAVLPPAILGMWLGGRVSDKFDQALFRKITLWGLIFGGLNLLRRGVFG